MPSTQSCQPCCTTPQQVQIPGVQGADGVNGTSGIDSFSTVDSPGFTVPAAGGSVSIPLTTPAGSLWAVIGQQIVVGQGENGVAVSGPFNFVITSIADATHVTATWLNYPGDGNTGTSVPQGAQVSPAAARGGNVLAVTTVTNNYNALLSDDVILVNVDNKTVTLPTAVGNKGKVYYIKQIAAFASGTVIATVAGNIDGVATKTLGAQYRVYAVISDGANWFILSGQTLT